MKLSRIAVIAAVVLGLSLQFSAAVWADEAANALSQARLALKGGDKASARSLFEAIYLKFPDSPQAPAAMMGHAYLVLPDDEKAALEQFRTVATRYPDSPEAPRAWLRVAYIKLRDNQTDAVFYFKLISEQYPGTPQAQEAVYRLGRLSVRDKDYDKAVETLQSAESAPGLDVTRAQTLVHLGNAHIFKLLATRDKAELEKAEEIMLHIEEKCPGEARSIMQARVDLARVYLFMGNEAGVYDPAYARTILLEALAKWPDTYYTPEAHGLVGFSFHYQGDNENAITYFEKLVKDYPASGWNSMLLDTIGDLNRRMGENAKAIDAYNRCIALDPNTDWARSATETLTSLTAKKATE
ncbi:MAG: tetratricopeptide repeat protein [Armatimonadota bacterium]